MPFAADRLARIQPTTFEARLAISPRGSRVPARSAAPSLRSLTHEVIEAERRGQRMSLSIRHAEVSKEVQGLAGLDPLGEDHRTDFGAQPHQERDHFPLRGSASIPRTVPASSLRTSDWRR
jgi:hypothetical protein